MKHEDQVMTLSQMFRGTYGVWDISPNSSEKGNQRDPNPLEKENKRDPIPKQIPTTLELRPSGMQKPHGESQDWMPWKPEMGPLKMNPQKFQEIIFKMRILHKLHSNENSADGAPAPPRFGFCKGFFTDIKSADNGQQGSNVESKFIYEI